MPSSVDYQGHIYVSMEKLCCQQMWFCAKNSTEPNIINTSRVYDCKKKYKCGFDPNTEATIARLEAIASKPCID